MTYVRGTQLRRLKNSRQLQKH